MSEHTKGSAHCEDCGLLYGSDAWADVVIVDEVWNSLCADLLCFNCMTAALVRAGHKNVPVLVASGPYVCDSEKWRLLGWAHGHKVGTCDRDELIEALQEWKSAEEYARAYSHIKEAQEDAADAWQRATEKRDAILARLAPKQEVSLADIHDCDCNTSPHRRDCAIHRNRAPKQEAANG